VTAIRLVSYNIHGAIGRDGWFAPARIRDVLAEIDPDVVALQEVESRSSGIDVLAWLARASGLQPVAGPTLLRADGHYGNALLVRGRIGTIERLDLSVAGREPRGALAADLECRGARLRVVATHLGLRPAERREQVRRLIALLRRQLEPVVLAGDLNEWFLWGQPVRWLHAHFKKTPAPPTFPAVLPVFALDRMWASPRTILRRVATHRSRLARVASDHLPLVGEIILEEGG
jgi:endonuclease/exonuclease/phosphatase family metal-dependent hydrolase